MPSHWFLVYGLPPALSRQNLLLGFNTLGSLIFLNLQAQSVSGANVISSNTGKPGANMVGKHVSMEFPGSLNRWYVPYNPPIGSIYHLYTTYIPLIYCLLGDYISPTTY